MVASHGRVPAAVEATIHGNGDLAASGSGSGSRYPWQVMQYRSQTVCHPVIRWRFSVWPVYTLIAVLKRYARPPRPWKSFEIIWSFVERCVLQLRQLKISGPSR